MPLSSGSRRSAEGVEEGERARGRDLDASTVAAGPALGEMRAAWPVPRPDVEAPDPGLSRERDPHDSER
jgi:hypothetical protein